MVALPASYVTLDPEVVAGDSWPSEPIEIAMTLADETTPVTGVIATARIQVRKSYTNDAVLAEISSVDGDLVVALDGSSVTILTGCISGAETATFPITDPVLPVNQQAVAPWDIEIIRLDGEPETIVRGAFSTRAQVTR